MLTRLERMRCAFKLYRAIGSHAVIAQVARAMCEHPAEFAAAFRHYDPLRLHVAEFARICVNVTRRLS